MDKKIFLAAFAMFVLCMVSIDSVAHAAGMKETLLCTCDDKRYDNPKELLPKCTRPVLTRPMCGAILPIDRQNCSALRNQKFKLAYDAVVLGRNVTPAVMALGIRGRGFNDYAALVGMTIETFFSPWTRSDVYIEVTRGAAGGGEYAKVDKITSTRIALIVRGAIFTELSPAAFIAKLGHEMIHVEQVRRQYTGIQFGRINEIVGAVNELEASTWETSSGRFSWKIGPNALWNCETDKERDFAVAVRQCREWQIQELLLGVNRNSSAQDNFGKWIEQNPWARANWLPRNRNWRSVTANNARSVIPIPSDPGQGLDCSSLVPGR